MNENKQNFTLLLLDPFSFEPYEQLMLKEKEKYIILVQSTFSKVIDFLLVNYVQPEAGSAIIDVNAKGKRNYLVEFTGRNEGLYYLAIVQKKPATPWESDEKKEELLEEGGEFQRVNFFAASYDREGYLGGSGSSEKVTWTKVYLSKSVRNYVFVDFEKSPREFTIITQGPSIVEYQLRSIGYGEVENMKWMLSESFESEDLTTLFFAGKLVRFGFKIMSNGFGIFVLKNYTEKALELKLELANAKNVKISKAIVI